VLLKLVTGNSGSPSAPGEVSPASIRVFNNNNSFLVTQLVELLKLVRMYNTASTRNYYTIENYIRVLYWWQNFLFEWTERCYDRLSN